VPVALPALQRSQKLQKRAAHAGFDWSTSAGVLDKLEEEIAELRAAMHSGESDAVEDEMGDVLFTCVNLARWLRLDAERALRRASGKFERRFRRVEELADARGATLETLDPVALDALWQAAKVDV